MKRKNGFTLVEILVTISLLSLIMIIVVPSVITINKKVKNKLYNTKVSQAEEATLLWVQDNPNCLNSDDDSCMISKSNCTSYADDENKIQCTITMGKLAANNLIKYDDEEKEDIYSPIDNVSMKSVEISFIYNLKTKLISIKPVKTTTTKQPSDPSDNPGAITLIEAIRNNYPNVVAPKTTPGKERSTENEALLASTPDDYGDSLYFRGNIENNYVVFAQKCWRIVRITGNNAIKLVLYNDNDGDASNPCDLSYSSTSETDIDLFAKASSFAKYDGSNYLSAFNQSYDAMAYVGYMYGTPEGQNYDEIFKNTNDSIILTNLKKWYDLSFDDKQKNKLADTIWCNDKGTRKGGKLSAFPPMRRGQYERRPTLKCQDKDGKVPKEYMAYTAEDTIYGNGALKGYKIGLLTADEIMFAGDIFEFTYTVNKYSYLSDTVNNSGKGGWWWTLSPGMFNETTPSVTIMIANNTACGSTKYCFENAYIRPAISLVSDVTISSGKGTEFEPFVIIEN